MFKEKTTSPLLTSVWIQFQGLDLVSGFRLSLNCFGGMLHVGSKEAVSYRTLAQQRAEQR